MCHVRKRTTTNAYICSTTSFNGFARTWSSCLLNSILWACSILYAERRFGPEQGCCHRGDENSTCSRPCQATRPYAHSRMPAYGAHQTFILSFTHAFVRLATTSPGAYKDSVLQSDTTIAPHNLCRFVQNEGQFEKRRERFSPITPYLSKF